MTPLDWERCLTFHYLHSDGPLGASPLIFLDATPAELAAAAMEHGVTEGTAQSRFVSSFNRSAVQSWLNEDFAPPSRDGELPGYFRYLVLTALVTATEEGVGNNHDFRDRLGALLGGDPLSSVSGVNTLWSALVGWCKRQRAAGKPIRAVVLPSYGHMNLIGYALRIAFPSWRDRRAFARVLRTISAETRRHPERLCHELARQQQLAKLPYALKGAFDDFQQQIRAGRRMLLGHRFWALVRSIDAQLDEEQQGTPALHWTLEARFGGWEQDVLELRLSRSTVRGAPLGDDYEGSLEELMTMHPIDLPTGLAKAIQVGVLIFGEGPGASWILSDEGPSDDGFVRVIARDDSNARLIAPKTTWLPLGGRWSISGRLDPTVLVGLLRLLGYGFTRASRLKDLTISGGFKTGRTSWLGRPALLPVVSASQTTQLSICPVEGSPDIITLSQGPPEWQLKTPEPVSGHWLISAAEGSHETDKMLVLEADAPERWDWAEIGTGKFTAEKDLVFLDGDAESPRLAATDLDTGSQISEQVRHLLEAIYAGAPNLGWAESELVPLLEPHLPKKHFVWDFLRALAEASWLEPVYSLGWGARRWQLRRPSLFRLTPRDALVEGAVGAAAEHRLVEAVSRRGGLLTRQTALSEWVPAALFVQTSDLAELAQELAWPMCEGRVPEFASAPRCWPEEPRTIQGRELAGAWSFRLCLFLSPGAKHGAPEKVALQRWVRERKDDRDVFRVVSQGQDLVTSSRTTAILEAYRRRGEPLFSWSKGRIKRVTRSGYLPLPVARSLRRRFLLGSGPMDRREGGDGYVYAADLQIARWLRRKFGPVIAGVDQDDARDPMKAIVAARRVSSRLSLYAALPFPPRGRELP